MVQGAVGWRDLPAQRLGTSVAKRSPRSFHHSPQTMQRYHVAGRRGRAWLSLLPHPELSVGSRLREEGEVNQYRSMACINITRNLCSLPHACLVLVTCVPHGAFQLAATWTTHGLAKVGSPKVNVKVLIPETMRGLLWLCERQYFSSHVNPTPD